MMRTSSRRKRPGGSPARVYEVDEFAEAWCFYSYDLERSKAFVLQREFQ